jgi:hypothetical protein
VPSVSVSAILTNNASLASVSAILTNNASLAHTCACFIIISRFQEVIENMLQDYQTEQVRAPTGERR